jgi:NAD(P)-dependent dehydrogenase (short-subunit alcohol dehydrogenase family)
VGGVDMRNEAGVQTFPGNAAYFSCRFALNGLSKGLILAGRPRNVWVNSVCQGNTQTAVRGEQASAEAQMKPPAALAEVASWLAVSPATVLFDEVSVTLRAIPDGGQDG